MVNMQTIEITDDKAKMEVIGKRLIDAMPSKYDARMLKKLHRIIDLHMPAADTDAKMARLYRAVYNYWVYGNDVDEDFYLGFDSLVDAEKRTYMTMRKKLIYLAHLNDREHAHLFDNKFETYQLLQPYYHRDVIEVKGPEDRDKFLEFIGKHPSFVVKPVGLSFAIGVYRVDITDDTDIDQIFSDLLEKGRDYKDQWWGTSTAVVLEELIVQSEELARLHPSSVNGVRVTTVRVGEKIHIYHPWIKVGIGGSFIAAASQGGMDIGIDPETGVLSTDGFNEEGQAFAEHPTSGVRFIGYRLPRWDELREMAVEVASGLPLTINYIGWDFVLTDSGWCIMEGNYAGDFMWQMFERKGMIEEFESLIGWRMDKDYWWQV